MRQLVIPAAGLALIASASLAAAQGPERQGGRQGERPGAPHLASPHPMPSGGPKIEPAPPPTPTEGRVFREGAGQAEQRQRAESQQHLDQERARAEQERSAAGQRAIEDEKRPEERLRPKPTVQPEKQAHKGDVRGEPLRQARERLSGEERRRLHAAFDLRRARVANATFDWHVGHRVPRGVRLYPVPSDVISFFPYYRGYSYFVVGDEICIVDPRTFVVVDVIDEGYPIRPQRSVVALSLSPAQLALVRDSIAADFPEADLRLRLALGAEIPVDARLHDFPQLVFERVPQLRDYRFLLVQDQIVIVDPRDRSIALVEDRW